MKTHKKKPITEDPYADIIMVRSLSFNNKEKKNIIGKREETVKKDKFFISQNIGNYERPDKGPGLEKTGLKYFLPPKKKVHVILPEEKVHVPRQLKRATLGADIKMIPMRVPRFGGDAAVVFSNFSKDSKINSNEMSSTSTDKIIDKYNYEQNLIEDAQREIDISQNQLEKIRSILKNKAVDEFQVKCQELARSEEKGGHKQKVISTLSKLNKKLNDMNEKYFSSTNYHYKSIKDIPINTKKESVSDVTINIDSESDLQIDNKNTILQKFGIKTPQDMNFPVKENKDSSFKPPLLEKEYQPPGYQELYSEFSELQAKSKEIRNKLLSHPHKPKTHSELEMTHNDLSAIPKNNDMELTLLEFNQTPMESDGARNFQLPGSNKVRNRRELEKNELISSSDDDRTTVRSVIIKNKSLGKPRSKMSHKVQDSLPIAVRNNRLLASEQSDQVFKTEESEVVDAGGVGPICFSIPPLTDIKNERDAVKIDFKIKEIKRHRRPKHFSNCLKDIEDLEKELEIEDLRELLNEEKGNWADYTDEDSKNCTFSKEYDMQKLQQLLTHKEEKLNTRDTSQNEINCSSYGQAPIEIYCSPELPQQNQNNSVTSHDFYDCSSQSSSPQTSPCTSNKKIFYDNFGRFSSNIQNTRSDVRDDFDYSSKAKTTNTEENKKTVTTIFDNTPLQKSVLKSDFLTKSFSNESAKQSESHESFTGLFDMDTRKVENRGVKNMKMGNDMYLKLTNALSNSFYQLPPQN